MYASAFFALCVALVLNITAQVPLAGFIPVVRWIDVAVNAVAAGLCVFLFIKPDCKMITYVLFFIEGGVTAHMGFVGIGTLLFTAGCVMVFVNGDFKTRYKEKIAALCVYWILITAGLYFSFNIKIAVFEIALTLFHFGLLVCLYKKFVGLRHFGAAKVFYSRHNQRRKNIRRARRRISCKCFGCKKRYGSGMPSFRCNKQRRFEDFAAAI